MDTLAWALQATGAILEFGSTLQKIIAEYLVLQAEQFLTFI